MRHFIALFISLGVSQLFEHYPERSLKFETNPNSFSTNLWVPWGPGLGLRKKRFWASWQILSNFNFLENKKKIVKKSKSGLIAIVFFCKIFWLNPHAPDRFTPHVPVAQKIADRYWLIANSAKNGIFLYKTSATFCATGAWGLKLFKNSPTTWTEWHKYPNNEFWSSLRIIWVLETFKT